MPFLKRSLIFGLLFFSLLLTPQAFLAAASSEACTCFCGTTASGAQSVGISRDGTACASTCNKEKQTFVGCFTDEKKFPVENDRCWTENECNVFLAGETGESGGRWGGQSLYCSYSKAGEEMGYCYGGGAPVNLNIPIFGQTSISGLPEYISLVYRFLLPAISLIAVVMIMVGGLQYATARGNAKAIDQARERINNAIIGLVLLMSAYAIANLLDPRLLFFDRLKVPLVKKSVLLDPSTSCEALSGYGYKISPPNGACGDEGTVTSVDGVDEKVVNSNFKVNSKCDFHSCAEGLACSWTSDGNECFACSDVSEAIGLLTPSSYVCNGIATRADAADKNPGHKYVCLFDDVGENECMNVSYGSDNYINCAALFSDYEIGTDPCSAYDYLSIDPATGPALSLSFTLQEDIGKIACEADYCDLAKNLGKKCKYIDGTVYSSCVSDSKE